VDTAANRLYIGDATSVYRFPGTTGAVDLYAKASASGTPFANVSGLSIRPATATTPAMLHAFDDSSAGAVVLSGHALPLLLTQAPVGPAGLGGTLPPSKPLTTAVLNNQSQTLPTGGAWLPGSLGGHLWTADHLLGFCRIDAGVINQATCATGPKAVGQPAF